MDSQIRISTNKNQRDKLAGWKEINHPPHSTWPPYHLQDAVVPDKEYIERLIDQEKGSGQGLLFHRSEHIDEETMSAWHRWAAAICNETPTKKPITPKETKQLKPTSQAYPRLSYQLQYYYTK